MSPAAKGQLKAGVTIVASVLTVAYIIGAIRYKTWNPMKMTGSAAPSQTPAA